MNLLENAIDSLNESLRQYERAVGGEERAYKFAIVHYAHFLELLFKHYVAESHPLLIYKNPFSANLRKAQTIGLWEAIQFLRNEGKEVGQDFFEDMEWLKNLRNNIEHHTFTLDAAEARKALGRITQATIEFSEAHDGVTLEDHIDADRFAIFRELADEFEAEIANARIEAKEQSEDDEGHDCAHCYNEGTAALVNDGYDCKFCGSRDIFTDCSVCTERILESEGSIWNDDHPPHIDYICYGCEDRISNM